LIWFRSTFGSAPQIFSNNASAFGVFTLRRNSSIKAVAAYSSLALTFSSFSIWIVVSGVNAWPAIKRRLPLGVTGSF
jgi:hypothetical protein